MVVLQLAHLVVVPSFLESSDFLLLPPLDDGLLLMRGELMLFVVLDVDVLVLLEEEDEEGGEVEVIGVVWGAIGCGIECCCC